MNLHDSQVWTPRATVAAVIERDGNFLMVEEDTEDGVRLNQPAGHLEPGESLAAAAIRETLEETAHVLQPVGLLGTYLWRTGGDNARTGTTYLRFAFVGTVGEPDRSRKLDVGIRRAVWMTADELRACPALHRSPLVMQCVDHYLQGRASGRGWIPLTALHTDLSVTDTSDGGSSDADQADADRSGADRSDADRSDADPSDADRSDADPSDADRSDADRSDAYRSGADPSAPDSTFPAQ